jgi:uncharacterized protein
LGGFKQTTLIIPGLNGSGPGHWQDCWLMDQPDAELVEQESWTEPTLLEWLYRLEAALVAHPGAILIAHSLGSLLVANLASRPSAAHVAGALLVAPCDLNAVESIHPGKVKFGALPVERLPFPSFLIASRNDPYMPIRQAEKLANLWGSAFLDHGNKGHFNVASGFGRWEEGYALSAAFSKSINRDKWELDTKNRKPSGVRRPDWSVEAHETVVRGLTGKDNSYISSFGRKDFVPEGRPA